MSELDPIPEENMAWDSYYRLYYDDDSENYAYTNMASGGYEPIPDTEPDEDRGRDNAGADNGDDDEDSWNFDLSKYEYDKDGNLKRGSPRDPDSTHPFEPGASSTPASGGEEIPMFTRTRLPQERGPSTAETSFSGEPTARAAWLEVKGEFELADENRLKARYKVTPRAGGGGGGAILEVSMKGKDKWYPIYTKSRGDAEKSFNASLPKEIKTALGKSLDEQVTDTNAALQEKQNELAAKQKQLEQAEQRAAESQKLKRDMDALTNRILDADERMRELEDAHGSIDTEAIQRLKDEKRRLEADKKSKQQQLSQQQKGVKQTDKIRAEVDKLLRDKRGLEERTNELRAKQEDLKPLDELKKEAEELETKIAEDKRVIEDENNSPSERAAAEARVAENEAELERVNTEIEVRERQKPLLERVKDIFKKYGWTLQAVALAVGVVLSALTLAGLNGLKAGTKAVGNGLKAIGQKLGSLLPGLIGSIVSFIFKAAGQVFSFLGEHAWLLILAVVAFFMERLLKRRRR